MNGKTGNIDHLKLHLSLFSFVTCFGSIIGPQIDASLADWVLGVISPPCLRLTLVMGLLWLDWSILRCSSSRGYKISWSHHHHHVQTLLTRHKALSVLCSLLVLLYLTLVFALLSLLRQQAPLSLGSVRFVSLE